MAKTMWAVGPEDGAGWCAINAPTEAEAIAAWCKGEDRDPDFICAVRVLAWDAMAKVTPRDWFQSAEGLSTSCEGCGEMASRSDGGDIIDGSILCACCVEDGAL